MGMKNLPIDKKKAVLYFLLLTFSFILDIIYSFYFGRIIDSKRRKKQ